LYLSNELCIRYLNKAKDTALSVQPETLVSQSNQSQKNDFPIQAISYKESDAGSIQQNEVESNNVSSIAISTAEVQQFIGEFKTVCGEVAQIKAFSKGIYLNFDYPYPRATFTAVVWDQNHYLIQEVQSNGLGKMCIQGEIESYKAKPQMMIKSKNQIVG